MSEDKHVDESWKARAKKEAEEAQTQEGPAFEAEPSFLALVSSLAMQAVVCLGHQPDPLTGRPIVDLPQAQYVIDLLGILADKTKGNLTEQESKVLDGTLHELRMLFVEATMPQESKPEEGGKPGGGLIIP